MQNIPNFWPKMLIFSGILLILLGLAAWLWKDKIGFSWFGHLPGDIRVERDNFRFYAPISSMLLLSLAFNLIWRMIRHFF